MFRRLIRALLGDFPPKDADLCNKCQTAYAVAGIINPSLTFDDLVKLLYEYNVLCQEPCGVTTPHLLPQQHPASFKLPGIFQESGISCENCQTSLITLTILAQSDAGVNRAFTDLQYKKLVCSRCLLAFTGKIDKISYEVISAVRGTQRVSELISGKR